MAGGLLFFAYLYANAVEIWQEVLAVEEHLSQRLARERNITVEEMRAIISAHIEKGWNDPDLEKRA